MLTTLFTIAGLALFEIINSLDNAVINSQILSRITDQKAKQFFITWGMLLSVVVVRGIAPLLIYYIPNRTLGMRAVLTSFWSGDPSVHRAVADAAPNLLLAGGMFLLCLFLHWLLVEEKNLGYAFEQWLSKRGTAWFYAIIGIIMIIIGINIHVISLLLSMIVGISTFFIIDGIKELAENAEQKLLSEKTRFGDWGLVLFLEAIDASFSVDGVVGAFAFTMAVPLILLGNGLGAYVVRRLTISSVEKISNYKLLANGAFYSIGCLSCLMILQSFGSHVPEWISPLVTFSLVGFFFNKSRTCH